MKFKLYIGITFILLLGAAYLGFVVKGDESLNHKKFESEEAKVINNSVHTVETSVLANTKLREKKIECSKPIEKFGALNNNILRTKILTQLQYIDLENNSKKVMDVILNHSGIGFYNGYQFLRKNDHNEIVSLEPEKFNRINDQQEETIEKVIFAQDINEFVKLYEQGTIGYEYYSLKNNKLFTPLHLLLAFKGHDFELLEYINRLINAGVKVRLSDLVVYTAMNIDKDIIALLSQHYSGDKNVSFFYEGELNNLVSLSITKAQIATVKFWLAEGVNASQFKYRDNALDFAVSHNIENKTDVISLLLEYGLIPNNKASFEGILNNITKKYKETHQEYLNTINPDFFTNSEHKVIAHTVNDIFTIVLTAFSYPDECSISLEDKKNMVKKIFLSFQQKQPDVSNKTLIQVENDVQSIFEKQKLLAEESKRQKSSLSSNELSDDKEAKLDREDDLLDKGDWEILLDEKIADGYIAEKDKLKASFVLALRANASSAELIKIIEQGAEISERLVGLIIEKCDIAVLHSLYDHGYNFNYEFSSGSNAISAAVAAKKLASLKFLINIGVKVNVKSGALALPPLSKSLISLRFYSQYNDFIETLLNAGAKVTDFDKKYVTSRAQSLIIYQKLLVKYPQFKFE